MAQLPPRIPTTYYISNTTTLAVDDNPHSSTDHKVIRAILCFFRSPKRKQGANPPPSEKFKFVACSPNPPPEEPPHSGFPYSSKSLASLLKEQDNEKIEGNIISHSSEGDNDEGIEDDSCFSYDFQFENSNVEITNGVDDSGEIAKYPIEDSPNDSEEITLDLFKSQNKEMRISTLKSMTSLPTTHTHGLSSFVVKIQKVMSHPRGLVPTILTKDAKRRLQILLLSLYNKNKSFFCKKENQQQIWSRPILMGKRCRKLGGSPHGDEGISKKGSQQQIWSRPILMGKRCRKLEDSSAW